MDDKLIHYLLSEFDKLRQEQSDFLSTGRAADHADYRYLCGVIRGLTHAESIVKDLVHRMERSNDDD
jgi:hypothetical protein